jgi:predicted lysophospholipase L1 biosynthesis ABC-type transport system permease subunit
VIAAGGLGLAPLRPVLYHLVRHRSDYGAATLLYGARRPRDLLYAGEYEAWRDAGIEVLTTVDFGDDAWQGNIGVVPALFERLTLDPARTRVFTCGPEIMMRFVIFESLAQNPSGSGSLVVRTVLDDPLKIAPAIRAAVQRVDPLAPVSAATTLETQLASFLLPRRFQTSLMATFSSIALLLAAVGIYGLMQYSVVIRTKEIGVRMAVGAQRASIFRMILGEGLKLALTGLTLGIVAAIPIGRALSSLLFGISPSDPQSLLGGVLLLLGVSLMACFLAARRAINIEPAAALRSQ